LAAADANNAPTAKQIVVCAFMLIAFRLVTTFRTENSEAWGTEAILPDVFRKALQSMAAEMSSSQTLPATA
jgi:hypothetical protein